MLKGRIKRAVVAAFAVTALSALAVPATAGAAPSAAPSAKSPQSVIQAIPQPNATPVSVIDTLTAANEALKKLGISPFLWPTIAPFCSATGPLGIVPAVAGAVPGPYTPIIGKLPSIAGHDFNTVKSGEVLYGFVPAGITNDAGDKSGMNVGWFNVNTFQGGFVPMGSLTDTVLKPIEQQAKDLGLLDNPITKGLYTAAISPLIKSLNAIPQAGVRAATVKTGKGMVLSAILGTVKNGTNNCFFLPTVGIQQVG